MASKYQTFEGPIIKLPSGKCINTYKTVYDNTETWYESHDNENVAIQDWKGFLGKDYPENTIIKLTQFNDVFITNIYEITLRRKNKEFNNKLILQIQLMMNIEEWNKKLNIKYLPQLIVNEINNLKLSLESNEKLKINEEIYLDHLFYFHISENEDISISIRNTLINYQIATQKAIQASEYFRTTYPDEAKIPLNFHEIKFALSNGKVKEKLIGLIVLVIFVLIAALGFLADFKEVFS